MIFCVWYPTGGFGHYLSAILSLHGKNFKRTSDYALQADGNSHLVELPVPKYLLDNPYTMFDVEPGVNYCVLVDTGISSPHTNWRNVFSDDVTTIKVCYNDYSLPTIFRTHNEKALERTPYDVIAASLPSNSPDKVYREHLFLYLRDNVLRFNYPEESWTHNIDINDFLDYNTLYSKLTSAGIELEDFSERHHNWLSFNQKYFKPSINAKEVIDLVKANKHHSLSHITDLYEQATVYFFIWIEFNIEVPHGDYPEFFTSTSEIINLISDLT